MIPKETHEVFMSTNFIIFKNEFYPDDIVLKIGNIHNFNTNFKSWAFITAWNPLPTILSYEENLAKNKSLLSDLINYGYKCHLGKGVSSDGKWEEDSFFIENISKAKALEISIKYGQIAFIYGEMNKMAELIYTQK